MGRGGVGTRGRGREASFRDFIQAWTTGVLRSAARIASSSLRFPHALDTVVGEKGILLSGGLYPAWVVVRETTVADSFTLDAKIPYASVAVGFLF